MQWGRSEARLLIAKEEHRTSKMQKGRVPGAKDSPHKEAGSSTRVRVKFGNFLMMFNNLLV
jgi:hypothetical protein